MLPEALKIYIDTELIELFFIGKLHIGPRKVLGYFLPSFYPYKYNAPRS